MPCILLLALFAFADDAEIARSLKEKGAKIGETKGAITTLDAADCSAWTEADFRQLGQLTHLKSLSLGRGVTDTTLPLFCGLPELEVLQTNECQVTDDGIKALTGLTSLKNLKLFHPGKAFSGTGLAQLAEMPNLERLTVAGSLAFGDEGMAAVGRLTRLKELRTWHAGQTLEGVKKLKELKNLKNLTLGQRLAYTPPTTLSDETLPVLAELTSLETLQLEEARLKLEALGQLKALSNLKKLILAGIDLSEADVERLRAEMPKVEIQWTRPSEVYLKRIEKLFGPK